MANFSETAEKEEQENGSVFRPKFDEKGLLTVITVDHHSGSVLMLAHMNALALKKTLDTGIAHYWSRSRNAIWLKGETSGNTQTVVELLTDCDQDALLLRVTQSGAEAACHTGRPSCFYRQVVFKDPGNIHLNKVGGDPKFDPKKVYDQ